MASGIQSQSEEKEHSIKKVGDQKKSPMAIKFKFDNVMNQQEGDEILFKVFDLLLQAESRQE